LKYLEELKNGEVFSFKQNYWLLTSDFKQNGEKLCYNINNGCSGWFKPDIIVDVSPIYILDNNNNIIPIREYKKENENNNIH